MRSKQKEISSLHQRHHFQYTCALIAFLFFLLLNISFSYYSIYEYRIIREEAGKASSSFECRKFFFVFVRIWQQVKIRTNSTRLDESRAKKNVNKTSLGFWRFFDSLFRDKRANSFLLCRKNENIMKTAFYVWYI